MLEDNSSTQPGTTSPENELTLFLTGDVMTGRGIDQIMSHPCEPEIFERYVKSALGYVTLAEACSGPIRRPVEPDYFWGDALTELDRQRPALRLINLETAVTTCPEAQPKGINYRMNPKNLDVIIAAGVDCCVLANNHVLDWGEQGLLDTLNSLKGIRVQTVGAGVDLNEAKSPAMLPLPGGRVIIFAYASPTAGVPYTWAAGKNQPGINHLPDLDKAALTRIASEVKAYRRPGDIVVASIHWGGNWGYAIPPEQREFAYGLIDEAGVDLIWGHSSHHPKAVEVHQGKLILFGCGDFLNDYEGIGGYERFRTDLVLMYLPCLRQRDGMLQGLTLVPFQIRNFRLQRATHEDARWMCELLDQQGKHRGVRFKVGQDDALILEFRNGPPNSGAAWPP